MRRKLETNNWPMIDSELTSILVTKHSTESSRDYWVASLILTYVVGGNTFTRNLPSGLAYTTEDAEQKAKEKFPLGMAFPLFYNPKNPRKTVLEQGLSESMSHKFILIPFSLGIIFLVFPLAINESIQNFEIVFGINFILLLLTVFYMFKAREEINAGFESQRDPERTSSLSFLKKLIESPPSPPQPSRDRK